MTTATNHGSIAKKTSGCRARAKSLLGGEGGGGGQPLNLHPGVLAAGYVNRTTPALLAATSFASVVFSPSFVSISPPKPSSVMVSPTLGAPPLLEEAAAAGAALAGAAAGFAGAAFFAGAALGASLLALGAAAAAFFFAGGAGAGAGAGRLRNVTGMMMCVRGRAEGGVEARKEEVGKREGKGEGRRNKSRQIYRARLLRRARRGRRQKAGK